MAHTPSFFSAGLWPRSGGGGGWGGFAGSGQADPGEDASPAFASCPCGMASPGARSVFLGKSSGPVREKIGITINHRSATWSYRTTASPLLRASQTPPNPVHSDFVATGPYNTAPLLPYFLPRLEKIAIREFTICTM